MTYAEGPLGGFISGGNNNRNSQNNLVDYFNSTNNTDEVPNPYLSQQLGFEGINASLEEQLTPTPEPMSPDGSIPPGWTPEQWKWSMENQGSGRTTYDLSSEIGMILAAAGISKAAIASGLVNIPNALVALGLPTNTEELQQELVAMKSKDLLGIKQRFQGRGVRRVIQGVDNTIDELAQFIFGKGPGPGSGMALANGGIVDAAAVAGGGTDLSKIADAAVNVGRGARGGKNVLSGINPAEPLAAVSQEALDASPSYQRALKAVNTAEDFADRPLKGLGDLTLTDNGTTYLIGSELNNTTGRSKIVLRNKDKRIHDALVRKQAREPDKQTIEGHLGEEQGKVFTRDTRQVYNRIENTLRRLNAKGRAEAAATGTRYDALTVEHIFDVQHWWKLRDKILDPKTTNFSGQGADLSGNITVLRQAVNSRLGAKARKFKTDKAFLNALRKNEFPDYNKIIREYIENNMTETIRSMTDTDWERLVTILQKEPGLNAHEALWQYFGKPTTKAAVKEQYKGSIKNKLSKYDQPLQGELTKADQDALVGIHDLLNTP